MTMHYVGTGVGHRQPADFPREDSQLKGTLTGESYVETATQEDGKPEVIHLTPANLTENKDEDEEDYDFGHDGDGDDNDSFDEEIYEI